MAVASGPAVGGKCERRWKILPEVDANGALICAAARPPSKAPSWPPGKAPNDPISSACASGGAGCAHRRRRRRDPCSGHQGVGPRRVVQQPEDHRGDFLNLVPGWTAASASNTPPTAGNHALAFNRFRVGRVGDPRPVDGARGRRLFVFGLAPIIGGAIGTHDRAFRSGDRFVDLHAAAIIGRLAVADAAIFCGVVMLIVGKLRHGMMIKNIARDRVDIRVRVARKRDG